MKQINNLQIRHRRYDRPSFYYVRTPDGRILEEFGTFSGAVEFCKNTLDFTAKRTSKATLTRQEARKIDTAFEKAINTGHFARPFKIGDRVVYKDEPTEVYKVYAIYPDHEVSLGLKDYPDIEQDYQVAENKLEPYKAKKTK